MAFCLFAFLSTGVKIVSDLRSGGLSWSKFAFAPFCLLFGVVKIYLISDLEVSDGVTFSILPFFQIGKNCI